MASFKGKYLNIKSGTFWLGVLQILLGVSLAVTANVEKFQVVYKILSDLGGNFDAYQYIVGGSALITLRGAMK